MYSQGDILLFPIPFTDLSSKWFGKVKLEVVEKVKANVLDVMNGQPVTG